MNHALSLGLKVGLGTDVAGGIQPSMLSAQRMAVVNSRCLRAHKLAVSGGTIVTPEMEKDVITFKEALWLATVGGAQVGGGGGSGGCEGAPARRLDSLEWWKGDMRRTARVQT